MSEVLTNALRPDTAATLTVRIIKSFTYRTEKSLVIHDLDLTVTTVGDLKRVANDGTPLACFTHLGFSLSLQPSQHNLVGNLIGMQFWVCPIVNEIPPQDCQYYVIDTMKLYTKAHGSKVHSSWFGSTETTKFPQTSNLIINLDHDDWLLEDDNKSLKDIGCGEYFRRFCQCRLYELIDNRKRNGD